MYLAHVHVSKTGSSRARKGKRGMMIVDIHVCKTGRSRGTHHPLATTGGYHATAILASGRKSGLVKPQVPCCACGPAHLHSNTVVGDGNWALARRPGRRTRVALDAQAHGAQDTLVAQCACIVYAHPTDEAAQEDAQHLVDHLNTLPGSTGTQQVLQYHPAQGHPPQVHCQSTAIYFGPLHSVELLRAGEVVGKGLQSELPRVLQDLCSPQGVALSCTASP